MKFIPEAIGRTVARNSLLMQKNSPGILFGAGIIGMVGSTVLACRATLKMDSVLEEAQEKLNTARTLDHPEYSEQDRRKDISVIYVQSGFRITKLYIPAVIIGGFSIVALTRSHNILNRRNVALTAAYGALEKGFNEYRSRVVEKFGEEQDRDFRYGARDVEIDDPEKPGKKKIVKRVSLGEPSIYARFFDDASTSWNREPEYNLVFIKAQQNYANDRLRAYGHVFLNEVYDMLGIPRSKAGAVVGWVLSPDGDTDNYISFGVFEGETAAARDFVNGVEGSILLDFNVDGVIFDKIEH